MRRLYVLYDGDCVLCRRLRNWLYEQPHLLQLELMPADSEAAKRLFPTLAAAAPKELLVVSDEGHFYRGNHAWIMCLYALSEYRDWSYRLAHPLLLPLAKQAFETLSHNRGRISKWMRTDEETIARELHAVRLPECDLRPTNLMRDYLE